MKNYSEKDLAVYGKIYNFAPENIVSYNNYTLFYDGRKDQDFTGLLV